MEGKFKQIDNEMKLRRYFSTRFDISYCLELLNEPEKFKRDFIISNSS